ncbi:hypothetical protein ACFL1H_02410 [Nanoarchaeota archaeon]
MGANLSGWWKGQYAFGDKIFTLGNLSIRDKIKDDYVEECYDWSIDKIKQHPEYFKNNDAFMETFDIVLNKRRPKLVARETVYPNFFKPNFPKTATDLYFSKDDPKYFNVAHVYPFIKSDENHPSRKLFMEAIKVTGKSIDEVLNLKNNSKTREIVLDRPLIEIPNDENKYHVKTSTLHEALHNFIAEYEFITGKLFTDDDEFSKHSNPEKILYERIIEENFVQSLTGILVKDDEMLTIEHKRPYQQLSDYKPRLLGFIQPLCMGLVIGQSIIHPELLPLLALPPLIKRLFRDKIENRQNQKILNFPLSYELEAKI